MALMNYTTTVSVERTITEITRLLVKHRAKSVVTEFDEEGQPWGLAFEVVTLFGDRAFRLPVRVDAVERILIQQRVKSRSAGGVRAQASRVAWRIVKDWMAAQLAILETEMVTMDEIMLPYLVTADQGRTLYEVMAERQLVLSAPREG